MIISIDKTLSVKSTYPENLKTVLAAVLEPRTLVGFIEVSTQGSDKILFRAIPTWDRMFCEVYQTR